MANSPLALLAIAVATIQVAYATYAYYPPCDPPQRTDYGGYQTMEKYPVGTRVTYMCDKGYVLYGAPYTVCRYSDRRSYWTNPAPVCKRKFIHLATLVNYTQTLMEFYVIINTAIRCSDLENPDYGSVEQTGNKPGAKARYECDKGFKLVGDDKRECLYSGYWSGKAPACKRKCTVDINKLKLTTTYMFC